MSSTTWTAIVPWITGDVISAARFNGQYGDNLTFLRSSVPTQTFRGMLLRTHQDADKASNQVALLALDEILMSDGGRYTGVTLPLAADISITGAGGLDTGARVASTWYEIYLIGKSSTQAVADLRVLLHRAKDYKLSEQQNTANGGITLRDGVTSQVRIGQSFTVGTAGKCEVISANMNFGSSAPVGNIWFTIEGDTAGFPSGTPLATSDKFNAALVGAGGNNYDIKFPFRTPATLALSTTYHLVMYGDYTPSSTVSIKWQANSAGGYANGRRESWDGTTWTAAAGSDMTFKLYITENDTAPTLPSGYDQSCKIGYVFNNGANVLSAFQAKDRTVYNLVVFSISAAGTVPLISDCSSFLPPLPVRVAWGTTATAATGPVQMGPVTDGYALSGSNIGFHGTLYVDVGTISNRLWLGELLTEFQSVYITGPGAGTGVFYPSSYTW